MLIRLLVLAVPMLFFWLWKRRGRQDQERAQLVVAYLEQNGGQRTYMQLASRFPTASWLARVLASLRARGELSIDIPNNLDRKQPREEQILYRLLSKKRPKGF